MVASQSQADLLEGSGNLSHPSGGDPTQPGVVPNLRSVGKATSLPLTRLVQTRPDASPTSTFQLFPLSESRSLPLPLHLRPRSPDTQSVITQHGGYVDTRGRARPRRRSHAGSREAVCRVPGGRCELLPFQLRPCVNTADIDRPMPTIITKSLSGGCWTWSRSG